MSRLVVVESPTKARTIRRFLPDGYVVEASMGHVRDLPASAKQVPAKYKKTPRGKLGVDVENDFEPLYIIPPDKQKIVKELKRLLKDADELFIATDEDREGESIGWHLLEVLKPKVPVKRMVFHEITKEAILEALEHTRDMDRRLIDAQETRRVLDRLVGYSISPLLWKKIAPKLSAGRVQSVAVRLVVNREKERIRFVPAGYWDIEAGLSMTGKPFTAQLERVAGVRIAGGKSFDQETGRLKEDLVPGKDVVIIDGSRAEHLVNSLNVLPWQITSVESKVQVQRPKAPFITSTLQQEASRKLRMSARQTMQVAQKLYEQGLITYMRTDSTALSTEAVEASHRAILERYGKEYLAPGGRKYDSKVRNAQEAHEAIRPAGKDMKTREENRLTGDEGKLYDLIWKRTVASQMADARIRRTRAEIEVGEAADHCLFKATGQTIEFPGFRRAYVEGSDDPEAELEDRDQPLPPLAQGNQPDLQSLEPKGHETKAPARLTDATLIRVLEAEGIGRPSTYASIIDTIVGRGYARRQGSQLIPSFTAFATTNLLEQSFGSLVDVGFTAGMEQSLDNIATGDADSVPYLQRFYAGESGLATQVEAGLDAIDARSVSEIRFPKWDPYIIRVGKYGPYVEIGEGEERKVASLPEDLAPGDVTGELLAELVESANEGDRLLGIHPEHDMPILVCKGPYGYYIQLGDDSQEGKPKRISVPKGMDPAEVTLEEGIDLLSLPRELGNHPETGQVIKTHIGRFGPYVQLGTTYASLTAQDNVLTIELARALELLAKKLEKNKPLKVLGNHPDTGDPIQVFEGRYGPYVKHQKTNASLPKGLEIADVTLTQAVELIAARDAAPKRTKGRRKSRK